jgi:hypothetical protein
MLVDYKDLAKQLKDNEQAWKGFNTQLGFATMPWETTKAKALGSFLEDLNKLPPGMLKVGVGIADIGADVAKGLGSMLVGAAGLKIAFPAVFEAIKTGAAGAVGAIADFVPQLAIISGQQPRLALVRRPGRASGAWRSIADEVGYRRQRRCMGAE